MAYTAYTHRVRRIPHDPEFLKPVFKHSFFLLRTVSRSPERGQIEIERKWQFVDQVPSSNSVLHYIQQFADAMTSMDIPDVVNSEILQKIVSDATDDEGFDYVELFVEIFAITYVTNHDIEHDDIARAERESMELGVKTIPANKESIDSLERFVFNGSCSSIDCMVCMGGTKAGEEGIRLPCSHVYHANCIVKWLQTSHCCPLCRYKMPFDV